MSRRKNPSSVDIQKVLLDMREYRMGLIQTPDQLRFSYMAVIEGAKLVLTDNSSAQVAAGHRTPLLKWTVDWCVWVCGEGGFSESGEKKHRTVETTAPQMFISL